jgi:hypothetical protein
MQEVDLILGVMVVNQSIYDIGFVISKLLFQCETGRNTHFLLKKELKRHQISGIAFA